MRRLIVIIAVLAIILAGATAAVCKMGLNLSLSTGGNGGVTVGPAIEGGGGTAEFISGGSIEFIGGGYADFIN